MKILGISAFYHDSAAAILVNGTVVAAAQEERFTEVKNDASFPLNSITYCLKEAKINSSDLDAIVFYDKPFLKFERLLDTYFETAPRGFQSFIQSMPIWLKEKVFLKSKIKKEIKQIDSQINWKKTQLLFSNHHLSHASSAFYASPFDESAILTIDGVGEWATASISHGKGNQISTLKEIHYPHSLGLLYSSFTYYLGFEVNSGEYKVMGLAPYATPSTPLVQTYIDLIKTNLITIYTDGSIALNQECFTYSTSMRMTNDILFENLFGFKKRAANETLSEKHFALAQALQQVLEEVILKMAIYAKEITQSKNLCLAGGVALNAVANGKLQESGLFEKIYIQPAAGDSGAALGAAWIAHYMYFNNIRKVVLPDAMKGALLGPSFSSLEIEKSIQKANLKSKYLSGENLENAIVERLLNGKIIGWFEGRMEFGPRALGARSILANPLIQEMQSVLNLKVKKRESFRPFAPIMLREDFEKYFLKNHESPYMLMVHKIAESFQIFPTSHKEDIIEKINQKRSPLPAITHVDYSSRIQTINQNSNPIITNILKAFKAKTGYGVLINTSFNVNNMPIVCSPEQAIRCFINTEIDCLFLDGHLIDK
ncbi:MAG: carbamoyltransferase [Bacteroidia bacterium]|nr:carbamoyltransferase [Bacteroidia bacterium]MCF8427052.1 carbamoyltransferase [Bacteroidia bacterium]MCF8446464.1 carbamoyltransferase [Bacteroidia bacterium]